MNTETNNLIIRKAKFDDATEIALMHKKAWEESYIGIIEQKFLNNISLEARLLSREKILKEESPEYIHLVAIMNEKIIGFCDAGPLKNSTLNCLGEVYAIYILEDFKNKGVGSKLINQAASHLKQNNLTPFIIWVLEANLKARKFYEKHGGYKFAEKLTEIGEKKYKELGYLFN